MNIFRRTILLMLAMMLCVLTFSRERSEEKLVRIASQMLYQQPGRQTTGYQQPGWQPGRQMGRQMGWQPGWQMARRSAPDGSCERLRVLRRLSMLSLVGTPETGFVLVSHDDRVKPVLGYSLAGGSSLHDDASLDNLPCGLEWYLQALDNSLQELADNDYEWTPAGIRPGGDERPFVEPLIETDWYQGTPFNDWLPTYMDDQGNERHYATDCSTIAAAQLMYYYHYPDVGRGEVTYTYPSEADGHEIGVVCHFDTISYGWDKMAVQYHHARSDDAAANEEVARLCWSICTARKMFFRKEGSSAGVGMRDVLCNHFGYSTDTRWAERHNYSDETWMHLVFSELSNDRPVYYAGLSPSGDRSHVFVLDGYDADGLVHVNWGWSWNSYYDGYFDMNYLHPNHYDTHFSASQVMLVNARPEGKPIDMQELNVMTPGSLAGLIPAGRSLRLKITGILDERDLSTLRQLGGGVKDGDERITAEVTHLDLSGATLPNDLLPDSAFFDGRQLLYLVLPANLKHIGVGTFRNCFSLRVLHLPSSITDIGDCAFLNCNSISTLTLPQSLTSLGLAPFGGCVSLTDFFVESGNTHFSTIDGILTDAAQHTLVSYPEARTEAVIPPSIESIGPYAFFFCTRLEEIRVPSNVRQIDNYAFLSCRNLARLDIEDGVEKIGNYVLYGCENISDVYSHSIVPLRLSQYVFDLTDLSHSTLHVPEGCRYAYSESTGWQQFGTIIDDLPNVSQEEEKYQYNIAFNITRSSQTAFNRLVVLAPCPQTNEYQDVHVLDITSNGVWKQGDVAENQNKFLELDMSGDELKNRSLDFSVGYKIVLSHKSFFIDFSSFKNADGSWKEMPQYDTSQQDYIDNIKQSGDYVVPGNSTIKAIADQLYAECGGNRLAYAEKCCDYVASHYKYLSSSGLNTLEKILADGGGDCGNLSSIYISLLRAKGIPARHVIAIGGNHVWSEFYIQDFGWVPVDVSIKTHYDPQGNYFGRYDGKWIVVQRGVAMDYPTYSLGMKNFNILQNFRYWYWTNTSETMNITQDISSEEVTLTGIVEAENLHSPGSTRKVLKGHRIVIERNGLEYNLSGLRILK